MPRPLVAGYARRTQAKKILLDTDTEINIELDEVRARNREERGLANARADETLNRAIRKDPDYYIELKKREIGEAGLDARKKIFSTWLFDFFFPRPTEQPKMPREGDR